MQYLPKRSAKYTETGRACSKIRPRRFQVSKRRSKTSLPQKKYKLIVITKGNTADQQNKMRRSGLERYFSHIEIVPDKTEKAYLEITDAMGINTGELMMVGNSFKSDIAPVLRLGGCGVYIPARNTWQHEITEEFDHPNLFRITGFKELTDIL